MWESLIIRNDILYRKNVQVDGVSPEYFQIVAPDEVRSEVFRQLHSTRLGGHLGRDRTLKAIKLRFYWPGMAKDVKVWCNACDLCARRKPGPGLGRAPLKQDISTRPLDRIAIDILGPLPVSSDGNEYIMVVGGYFTKYSEAYAISDHTALTVADKLVCEFMCRFGIPTVIHTDQGREFESNLFKELCRLLEINKTRTTPYNPKSDGMIERLNRSILQMLSMFVNENRNDWDIHLPFVMMAYRSTCHDSTKFSPNMLMFGREIAYPIDVMFGDSPDRIDQVCPSQYVEWLKQSMELSFDVAFQNLKLAASRQKKTYDRGLKPRQFSESELVWRWYPPLANLKLSFGWTGPYKIIKKITDLTYQIQHVQTKRNVVVHVDHLKKYQGNEINDSDSETI
jgi:transposase InsO family protein